MGTRHSQEWIDGASTPLAARERCSSHGGAGWREGWTEGNDRWDLSTVERMIKTATEYLGVLRYEDGRARASQHQLGHMYASPVLCPAAA